jgi:hypothetical protein
MRAMPRSIVVGNGNLLVLTLRRAGSRTRKLSRKELLEAAGA